MVRAFLLLGSNQGNRKEILRQAITSIAESLGGVTQSSRIYETDPWGKEDQDAFLNQVLEIETSLKPDQLLQSIHSIERDLGRVRSEKWGPRTIDIDILFYGDEVIHESDLIIPHPDIASRRFTLVPLHEIAPNLIHPVSRKSVVTMLAECEDKSGVREFFNA